VWLGADPEADATLDRAHALWLEHAEPEQSAAALRVRALQLADELRAHAARWADLGAGQ
jgi:hypothetical protein